MSLYGVRLFYEKQGYILSPVKKIAWDNDILKALCIDFSVMPAPHEAEAPAEGCACGFYANWTTQHLLDCANRDDGSFAVHSNAPFVVGLVEAYGKVITHEYGFRAEYMRIAGFLPVITEVKMSGFLTGEVFLGFPIRVQSKHLSLKEDAYYGTFCSELIGVQCVGLDAANYLLNTSFLENA